MLELLRDQALTAADPAHLLQNESIFRQLLDRLPVGAYTCDSSGLITYFNQQVVGLWGRAPQLHEPADRFCGSFKLYLPDGTPLKHEDCWLARALATGRESDAQEVVIERPDQTRRAVLAHATPLHDDQGHLLGAVNVLIDITARERAIEAQRHLAAIVESSDDAIISKTLTGVIRTWNRGAERVFGYTAEEAVGKPIVMLIPPDRQHEERIILKRLRRGERIEHYETVRMRKDGTLRDISLTISPVLDDAGNVVAVAKVARDITAQRQAQTALVALKDQLSAQLADLGRLHEMSMSLSSTLDMPIVLDETLQTAVALDETDLGILSLCDEETGGLRLAASVGFEREFLEFVKESPIGSGVCGLCHEQRQRIVVEDIQANPQFADYRNAAQLGGFQAVHSTPLVTRSGKMVGVLSTHHRKSRAPTHRAQSLIDLCARQAADMIENARLYSELQAAGRSKDEFLAVLAHELRNPMAPVRNSLHVLRLSGELNPVAERAMEVMDRQVSHLVRLVDDLLEISRISRGKIELRRERVDLASIVLTAVETSRPLIDEAGHELSISVPIEPLTIDADAVRVAQIISNLLNNAAKYTNSGGKIWLSVQRAGGDVAISVRDTGIGIAADKLRHVFDMFTQLAPAGGKPNSGLGIGLTLVKRLSEMHGGKVQAQSAGLGQGSEFTVHLPLAPEIVAAPAKAAEPSPSPSPLSHRRILIVDDNHDAADSLALFLRFLGASIQVAYDGASALAALEQFQPAIMLLDIGMPVLDGYEVGRRARQLPAGRELLLIAMTGWGQEEDRRRTREAGFDHHLVKPVDPAALQELLMASSHP